MAHSDARGGGWRGNCWMEWVASTLTLPRNTVYPALLPLMCTPRLPAVNWTDGPTDLNGLVRFPKRPSLVSAPVPSHFKRSLPLFHTLDPVFKSYSQAFGTPVSHSRSNNQMSQSGSLYCCFKLTWCCFQIPTRRLAVPTDISLQMFSHSLATTNHPVWHCVV
jgi:hypothetical protein